MIAVMFLLLVAPGVAGIVCAKHGLWPIIAVVTGAQFLTMWLLTKDERR